MAWKWTDRPDGGTESNGYTIGAMRGGVVMMGPGCGSGMFYGSAEFAKADAEKRAERGLLGAGPSIQAPLIREELETKLDGAPDGVYTLEPGKAWCVAEVASADPIRIYRAPDYDLEYVIRATRGRPLPYRGHIDGDRESRKPTDHEMTEHLPPDMQMLSRLLR